MNQQVRGMWSLPITRRRVLFLVGAGATAALSGLAWQTARGQAKTVRAGAKDASERAMSYAERNVESAFDFAQKLVHASSVQEVMRLQGEFVQAQMEALTEQARDVAAQGQGERQSGAGGHRAP